MSFIATFIVLFLLSLSSSTCIGIFIETWFMEFSVCDLNYSFIVSTVSCHHWSLEWLAKKQVALFSLAQNLILMVGFEPVPCLDWQELSWKLKHLLLWVFFNPFKLVLCELTVVSLLQVKAVLMNHVFISPTTCHNACSATLASIMFVWPKLNIMYHLHHQSSNPC